MLKEGDMAPDFTLPDQDGQMVKLADLRSKKVVLYFYPKDDTSGCTKEACGFRDAFPQFNNLDAVILGMSKDGQKSHKKFQDKYKLPFKLLSDEDTRVMQKYGVWQEKTLYGRKYMGTARITILIDETGKIRKIWPNVKVDGHDEEVLAAINSL